MAAETYPSGRKLTTCYDANGRAACLSGVKTEADCRIGQAAEAGAYASGLQYEPPNMMGTEI